MVLFSEFGNPFVFLRNLPLLVSNLLLQIRNQRIPFIH